MSDEPTELHPEHEDHYDEAYGASPETTPVPPTPQHGYWRSLRELDGKAALQIDRGGNEFPPSPEHAPDSLMQRRNFFQLMGASMGLAGVGLAGCKRYEKEEIVPLARRPEDQTPSQTQQYATVMEIGGIAHAILATSFEGRPIRLDGNPEHPFAGGTVVPGAAPGYDRRAGISTFAQASVLDLYDPDRSDAPKNKGVGASMDAFRATLAEVKKNLGSVHVLSEATSSPTVARLRASLVGAGAQWHEYEPISWDNERAGMKLAFGTAVRPLAKLDRCATVVTIDADIFVEHPAALRYSRDFAKSRRKDGSLGIGQMNRLWSIESTLSNTGAMADHRLSLRSEFGLPFAMALEAALAGGGAPAAKFLAETKVARYLQVLVDELRRNNGRAVVIAGRRQPPEVHAIVARINQAIGAVGPTLDYVQDPDADRPTHLQAITKLAKDMHASAVTTLIIIGGNPVYNAPADLDFAGALSKVPTSIHLCEYVNETSDKATWHVPRAHYLEAWGDARTWDGTVSIAQPLIAPLYGGLSAIELLALLTGMDPSGEQLVRDTISKLPGNWRQHVHDGFVVGSQLPAATPSLGQMQSPQLSDSQRGSSLRANGDLEVVFHYSSFTYDGRFANNAWLQETPDFLTKVTWDNYALVGPDTALALGLENDTMIKVRVGDRDVEIACYTIPGQAKFSIGLVLGGGRTKAGRVGGNSVMERRVGWDTNKVRLTSGFDIAGKATATATGKKQTLANVQEHWDIRIGLRPVVTPDGLAERIPELIRETTNENLQLNKSWTAEEEEDFWHDENNGKPRGFSLFEEKEYSGHRWAMAIDLSTCTGCNSCMVACQAENNVPVVGRKEVMNNREMHWIRIDRYFSGTPEDPEVVYQPLACQQCENAPCEQVCPVGATSHSDEGLNDQAYNRCIGTRYCNNNCPYKVRRFNFLDWNKEWRDARNKVRRLLFNPDVTVRMRGVMEKCTFCVQRIQAAKIKAKAEIRNGNPQRPGVVNAPLKDGEIVTACQAACPTEAIMFGDLSDKNSRVAKLHNDRRSYALIPQVYTKPRNRFLARVRNPHPELAPKAPKGGHE
jgi:MoCo/4Fe-4S cofactor protein with predicted Tat translocation signal